MMTDNPLIGRQLANFRIERAIGRGGMAEVYYGQDVKLERPVAIKIIDVRYRGQPAYAKRFVREAKTVATWRHENIIQIYYADDEDELYYFVMEYINGPHLGELMSQYVDRGELMPQDEVLRIGRAVANALDYAHRQGVIHRDVKPANVIVAGDGRIVLTDFGLAMDVEQGSLGEVFGSSNYIAPEQAHRSADAVPQSDLYSLGVILYEMLTGKVPFDDPSPTAVALQHLTLPPPPPREINPNLSAGIEAVLLKALSKYPSERYQTGRDLIDALERAMKAGRSVSVRPSATPSSLHISDTATDDLLGKQLDEYRLDVLLGQGGMARVYRGLDVRLKRWAAIKVIDARFRADSEYMKRFEREAQAIAQLEHPHIVRLYRYGEANGLLYMAMQYIEGADLDAVLATYREDGELIPSKDASRIVREVCLALDYAHSKGVVHRDVKPSNIMLDKEGNAILTDFGLALLTEVGTRGEIFGSPHYVAPEQAISSAGVVPQSDLYSIGVILYEMFTGELPFDADEPLDVGRLHMTEPPPPPRKLRPEISPKLEVVILKTLAKEPEDRYPSGSALADALDHALQSTLVKDRPLLASTSRPSTPERVQAELAEHPLPPIPAAVAIPTPRQVTPRSAPLPGALLQDPAEARLPAPRAPATAPVPIPSSVPARPSADKRRTTYMAGFGILLAISITLVILLAGVVFWLLRAKDEGVERIVDQALTTEVTTALAETSTSPLAAVLTTTATMAPPLTPSQAPPTTAALTITPAPLLTGTLSNTPMATPTPTSTSTPILTDTATPTSTPTSTGTPTATPTALPTAKPKRGWKLIADTRDEFSGSQGLSNWEYQWSRGRNSFDWTRMRFDGTCWRADSSEDYVRICQDSAHPGLTGDIAWRWTSEVDKRIRIRISARKIDTGGGDGVVILVYRNTKELKSWQLGWNDSKGFTNEFEVDIARGDFLFFVMKVGGDSTYDHTAFQAQIYHK
jgi:serine/threonine protein kinase